MDVRVRFFGGFDGNPRRAVVLAVDTTEADYAHVLLPAVQFNVRLLKSRHFIRIIGKLLISISWSGNRIFLLC